MSFPEPDIRWRAEGLPQGPGVLRRVINGELFRETGADFLVTNARRYGDLVRFGALGREVLQFNHPELVGDMLQRNERKHHRSAVMQRSKAILGEGLLTSEEPLHMRQRRLAQPAFHRARIHGYGEIIAQATAKTSASWTDGEIADVHPAMLLLALRLVGRTLFSLDFEGDFENGMEAIAEAVEAFQSFLTLAFLPFPELIQRLPVPAMQRIGRGRAHLDKLIYKVIAERRADPADRGDLLSMLLASVDSGERGDSEPGTEARMSDEQLRDECLTVLLAGHETTANALSFILWQLATHPELQEAVAEEATAVLGGRLPSADDYGSLRFTEQCVAEGLRLYPPVWTTSRMAAETYEYRGMTIRKGTFLLAPQIAVQRDGRFWPDPMRFDPSRFTKDAKVGRPKLAYFPFGAGSRQCIGEGLAWMEAVLALAVMVQDWKFCLPEGSTTAMKVKPVVTMRPHGPVRLRMVRR